MEFEESIYNLIPKDAYIPPKERRHQSKHNPGQAPTASTFCLRTTSKPGLSNVAGVGVPTGSNHTHKGTGNTFGLPQGAAKPNAGTFRLKGTGTIKIPDPNQFDRGVNKKVAVPKIGEKPIMGLVSDKNFIVSNAVENILAAPKLPGNESRDMLKKKNYGKVPRYLQTIKKEIEDEYQLVREMQIEDEAELDRAKFLMNDEEKQELIAALKKKWEVTHKEYQTLTHKNKLDTLGLQEKYERCERELNQLEKDIQQLSKNFIFVDTTQPSSFGW